MTEESGPVLAPVAPVSEPTWGAPAQYAAPPFFAPALPDPEAEARRTARKHHTARWTGAIVVAALLAVGSAFAVIHPARTDIPGLATAKDGRYVFPTLTLPTLGPGQPAPGDTVNNPGGQHLADIRKLLLPAPHGAVPDKSLPGSSGWLPEDALITMSSLAMAEEFDEYGLRHTAAVGWKTPDGASTSIYLLQFPDHDAASAAGTAFSSNLAALSGTGAGHGKSFTPAGTTVTVTYYTITQGKTTTRYGFFADGDTEALIAFSAPNSVSIAPFEQELQLQTELLQ